ncbi:oligosaccharyl transferase subunit ost3/OST6 [Recurvomyces mirabilis]|uniref:Oligosaccharyl transferase subunit ost3/OST6 n=1 Tax=Recurvomyces mirabilis TaxID=574656 RepID=A0AAE0TSC1_9PEZI|nr:oligosaccharyl transferase subunit ost3/OST6 [Recurvomyces mirabilis]KAK5152407.1 oligosaccharyl transferase subunit ost3/OST6 [Recurvomyces mirabilis]
MKVLQALTALLPLGVFGAKKAATGDRFQTYHSKQLSAGGPVKIDDKIYAELTKGPRDYSITVLLTALEARFGCNLCNEFQPEWEMLGKQWAKGDRNAEGRLLFTTLDFLDGKNTFQSLQMQTAPVLLLFPPTTGPNAKPDGAPVRFDFSSGTNKAEPIHSWLSRQLPSIPHPQFVRPINFLKIGVAITAVLGFITFATVAAPYILPVIQNRNLWAAVSLIAVLLFTSGHMFNHIRKVPYVSGDGKGGVSYFAGGFQNQFGLETQIVAAMYGVLSFATISLALKVPRMADARTQQIAVFVWGGVILGMYSFLLSVFRIKNGGYPFWLPPF